jgi:hypothetical protein
MKEHQFRVRWEIDVWGISSLDAAEQARCIQLDKNSTATVFDVSMVNQKTNKIGKPVQVDLKNAPYASLMLKKD